MDLRRQGYNNARKIITATPRQLESLIRISEALARMRFSELVEPMDVKEAIRLVRVALQQAAVDPRTGQIDLDLIATGHSAAERMEISTIVELIRKIVAESPTPLLFRDVVVALSQQLERVRFVVFLVLGCCVVLRCSASCCCCCCCCSRVWRAGSDSGGSPIGTVATRIGGLHWSAGRTPHSHRQTCVSDVA